MLFFGLMKSIYFLSSHAGTGIGRTVFGAPARLIEMLYGWLESFAPNLAKAMWIWAPDLRLGSTLVSSENANFFSVYVAALVGGYLCGQANRIEARVAQTMRRVEEMMWEESLRQQVRGGASPVQAMENLNLTITLAGQEPPWYQRPGGLVLFGIALPMVVEVLKVVVGLAKLP
jgi:hypothetical protein